MTTLSLFIIGAVVLLFGAVSGRLERTPLTPPMVFVGAGLLLSPSTFGLAEMDSQSAALHLLAEITLVVVLFTDAARIDFRLLARNFSVPLRMLAIGMPLTIAAGTVVAAGLFPELTLVELALLAAVLTPTDAALGQGRRDEPARPDPRPAGAERRERTQTTASPCPRSSSWRPWPAATARNTVGRSS